MRKEGGNVNNLRRTPTISPLITTNSSALISTNGSPFQSSTNIENKSLFGTANNGSIPQFSNPDNGSIPQFSDPDNGSIPQFSSSTHSVPLTAPSNFLLNSQNSQSQDQLEGPDKFFPL